MRNMRDSCYASKSAVERLMKGQHKALQDGRQREMVGRATSDAAEWCKVEQCKIDCDERMERPVLRDDMGRYQLLTSNTSTMP